MAMAVNAFADSTVAGIIFLKAYGRPPKPESAFQATMRQSSFVFAAGFWVCLAALSKLISGPLHPGLFAIVASTVSLVVNWKLHRFSERVGKKQNDAAIGMCRSMNKMNFVTAALSFVGVVLADLNLQFCDPLSAVLIGATLLSSALASMPRLLEGKNGWERTKTLLPAVVLMIGIAGHTIYDHRKSSDVVLVPSAGTTLDSPVEAVLGRAQYFVIADMTSGQLRVVTNGARDYAGHVDSSLVSTVESNQVDVVVALRIGEVFTDLQGRRVKMYYTGAPMTVRSALQALQRGELDRATAPNVGRGFGRPRPRWLQPW
jgi:predicted Fe-Mo cluster-binding NifX family protein